MFSFGFVTTVKGREDGIPGTRNEFGFALFEICVIMIMFLACIFPFTCAECQIFKCSYCTSNFAQNFHHKMLVYSVYIRLNFFLRITAWSHTPCTSGTDAWGRFCSCLQVPRATCLCAVCSLCSVSSVSACH